MPELPPLYYQSPRGQCAVMLLAALRDLYLNEGRGAVTKRLAIGYIGRRRWFDMEPEDFKPYPSQRWQSGGGEPRWHTLVAWARKDAVIRDMVSYNGWNMWGLTHNGRTVIDRFHEFCKTGKRPVTPCFLWSGDFKRLMYPAYMPSSKDSKRPRWFYRDLPSEWHHELEEFDELFE